MSQENPKISVLVPVYNCDRYLSAAIDSILNQTFIDFELLLMDDGSTDRSPEIMKAYAEKDRRIRVFSNPNQGIAKTLNALLREAKSDIVARMDGDDISFPDRFAKQFDFLQQHPEVVCIAASFDVIDEKSRLINHCEVPTSDREIQDLLLRGISLMIHPCAMYRKSVVVELGGYDETMVAASDLDLWLRLGEVGQLANLPETLIQYRLNKGSISHRKQEKQRNQAREACERAWQRRGITGTFVGDHTNRLHQHEFLLNCGWRGFNSGKRDMAIDYGVQVVTAHPFSVESWRLLLCALLKPLPKLEQS